MLLLPYYFFSDSGINWESKEDEILLALRQAFAGTAHHLRDEKILALLPALNSRKNLRPAPDREFMYGLLGFDDACKRFEKKSCRSIEFEAAYAKIEVLRYVCCA